MMHTEEFEKNGWTPNLSGAVDRKIRRSKIKFLILSIIFVGVAALMPHVIHGHILFLPRAYAESGAIILNFVIAFAFYSQYRKDVKSVLAEKDRSEKKLLSSYEYIGRANRLIQMLQSFSSLPTGKQSERNKKEMLGSMVKELAIEVFGAESAIFRFINSDNGRTLTEYKYLKRGHSRPARLSNRVLLKKETGMAKDGTTLVFVSRAYADYGILCAAGFEGIDLVVDEKTARALVNQVFLLFVFLKSVKLSARLLRLLGMEGKFHEPPQETRNPDPTREEMKSN